ncbi:hypothetical protein AYI69_g7145 [Smittium culicis]|uniref:Uncharacterized protein n=1 Tax=Smittium culicis TaxID=133412 RepID=A0A1R1XU38_9FUNG|nr:hypothetical protein AYI69_g8379 [Smittium culicis]OMJ18151.1 hypothetical protein AYI69_g7145 [Smittium culicis]
MTCVPELTEIEISVNNIADNSAVNFDQVYFQFEDEPNLFHYFQDENSMLIIDLKQEAVYPNSDKKDIENNFIKSTVSEPPQGSDKKREHSNVETNSFDNVDSLGELLGNLKLEDGSSDSVNRKKLDDVSSKRVVGNAVQLAVNSVKSLSSNLLVADFSSNAEFVKQSSSLDGLQNANKQRLKIEINAIFNDR